MRQQLTNIQRQIQGKDVEIIFLEERLGAKKREVKEL